MPSGPDTANLPEIREIRDLEFDRALELAAPELEATREDLTRFRHLAPSAFRGAFSGGDLVGFAFAGMSAPIDGHVVTGGVWVAPERRRSGLGGRLIDDLERVMFVEHRVPDAVFDCPPSGAGEGLLTERGYEVQGLDLTLPNGRESTGGADDRVPHHVHLAGEEIKIGYRLGDPDDVIAEKLRAHWNGTEAIVQRHPQGGPEPWTVYVAVPLSNGDAPPPRLPDAALVVDRRLILRYWDDEYDADLRDALVAYYGAPRAVWSLLRPNWHVRIPAEEVLGFLQAIEDGTVTLTPEWPPDGAAGNVPYRASNEWHITVFNDVNEWDYIDEIRTDDGRFMTHMHLEGIPALRSYDPGPEVAWTRYGIPGT